MNNDIDSFLKYFKNNFKHTSSFFSGFSLLWVDFLMIMLSIGLSFFIINFIDRSLINFKSFVDYWIFLPFFFLVFYVANLYPGIVLSPVDEVRKFSLSSMFCFAGIALAVLLEPDSYDFILSGALILAIPIANIFLPFGRQVTRSIFSKFKFWGVPSVIYIKNLDNPTVIDRLINHPELGYRPCVIICEDKLNQTEYRNVPIYNASPELNEQIKKLNIKVAIIFENNSKFLDKDDKLYSSIMRMYRYTVYIPFNQYVRSLYSSVRDINGIIGYSTTHRLTKKSELFFKRFIDILVLLIISIPILIITIIIAIAIKITSPGPVFYGHKRIGKNKKVITVWKFRSMVINSQELLEKILAEDPVRRQEWEEERKFKDDPRVTKIGKFLRKTSLDELPQIWNVINGTMSFVGPRPVTESELEKYGDAIDFVLSVKPGISGLWQVSGRSNTGYEERIFLDTYYIQNWSIWIDIWIYVKTIWVVLKRKGAY